MILFTSLLKYPQQELNSVFSMKLKKLLSTDKIAVDDAAVISIDSKGIDIKVRQGAQVPPTCLLLFSLSFT